MTTSNQETTISVIGLGYIGLPAAAMFASRRVKVIGVDVNQHAIDTINQGKIHIVEPELDMIVQAAVSGGYLKATNKPEPADAFLIAVPTPFKGDHEPDLSYVLAASESIAPVLKKGDVVILESTSPVGTTEKMVEVLSKARPDLKFPQSAADEEMDVHVAYCPERVLPGHVVRELVQNDRIIGGLTKECSQKAIDVYRIFVEGELLITDARTAEMSKLTENSFRDVNIAFANELSLICDKLGINVWELIKLANHHPRVNILQPGCGVGGHCIAVDPWFIVNKTPEQAKIVRTAREINDHKPEWVQEKVNGLIQELVSAGRKQSELKIACLGLAFKPDIDDLRESPALEITRNLAQQYPDQVIAVEPNIEKLPGSLSDVKLKLGQLEETLDSADVVVILVDHKQFKELKPDLKSSQRLFDAKGIW
ncbi:UDP-N-acetyl-D-mannosamine dehydrogenase [Advenella kashmirensis W13003]|uniref:NDP-N-acetyl-D-galactosaminuronic acid dehydrogenase n=1 Tax=Advenella kashmirensis W13003 TaxID=1424334 RepID=V8QYG3_9BURK|nr:UDP-N-acetyl-D-mannosamine dehydrogenase [Advenella kashmirensis]ETF04370.1 UDP-N-acetyl-D-mannosamine dehydrogenase [Advenella kashmirensis W13003]